MTLHLQVQYFDDKHLNLFIPEKEKDKFFECINKNMPYVNEENKVGFYSHYSNIRQVLISPAIEKKDDVAITKSKKSDKEENNNVVS